MPRVLVLEPDEGVRTLLCLMLTRLGHEPVLPGEGSGELRACDAILVEPAWATGVAVTKRVLDGRDVPVLGVSIYPPPGPLGLEVRRYLVKPVGLEQLGGAVAGVLSQA